MLLKRLYVDIDSVVFADRSYIADHVLYLNKNELINVVNDRSFLSVDIKLAVPGTNCRIVNMGDSVQPTLKLDDEDSTFPGIAGKIRTAGNGTSLMLRNVVVSETSEVYIDIPALLDMSDIGAKCTDLAKFYHVVIDALPAEGATKLNYLTALHKASKLLAKYLAQLAKNLPPDHSEEFSLDRAALDGLPRIAYLADVFCHAPLTEITLYGESMVESMPTPVHPNEILDGALTNKDYDNFGNADPTYVWQNHPIILELYRRHGVDLNFVGVVVNNVHHTVECKQRNATMSAAILNNFLRAEGCIITKEGGGHPQIDVGLATVALEEEYGIKTTLILKEFMSTANDSYGQLLFNTPYANAIVSAGCAAMVKLPKADTVIGSILRIPTEDGSISGAMSYGFGSMPGSQSQLGWTRSGSRKF